MIMMRRGKGMKTDEISIERKSEVDYISTQGD